MVILNGSELSIQEAYRACLGAKVALSSESKARVEASASCFQSLVQGTRPIYGVNTGFGSLAAKNIDPQSMIKLQYNILRSHASGSGANLSAEEARLIVILRANVLARGRSGIRLALIEKMLEFLNEGVIPAIPEKGSVGASGDLVPLAHMGLCLIGEGECLVGKEVVETAELLARLNLQPIEIQEKEGLSLINGTEAMGALAVQAVIKTGKLLEIADLVTAMSLIGFGRFDTSYDPRIHLAKGHQGPRESARNIALFLQDFAPWKDGTGDCSIQNPYSFRCAPQVHGASRDVHRFFSSTVHAEINSVTDNPLVFEESRCVLSGGNFHGQSLAIGLDMMAIATTELGSISERRIEQLLNTSLSHLPPFLSRVPGLNSGFMASQYLAASLVNENKVLSHPASTDSISTCGGIEDHVSMGMTSARKLRTVISNVETILAVELMCALQAMDIRGVSLTGMLAHIYKVIRETVPSLDDDRNISKDIEKIRLLISDGHLSSILDAP